MKYHIPLGDNKYIHMLTEKASYIPTKRHLEKAPVEMSKIKTVTS